MSSLEILIKKQLDRFSRETISSSWEWDGLALITPESTSPSDNLLDSPVTEVMSSKVVYSDNLIVKFKQFYVI